MKKTVTIIGASGQVGFRLAERLSHAFRLRCVVRDRNKKKFDQFDDAEVFQVEDIGNVPQLSKALDNSHVVINTGYIWFAEEIFAAIEGNQSRPEQIIFTGSTGIFTKLPSASAQQKRDAERYIRESCKIPWTIIRPTMIYGHPDDRNISRLIKALHKTPVMPLIGKGRNLIQPVFINDLLRAFEIATLNEEHFNKSYNIGACSPLSNAQLFRCVASALKRNVKIIPINPGILRFVLGISTFFKLNPITHEQLLRFQEDKDIDIEPFIDAFGFEPIAFEEGVAQLVAAMNRKNDPQS